jgi:hypothetical protein
MLHFIFDRTSGKDWCAWACRVLLIALLLSPPAPSLAAAERDKDPFQDDPRLQKVLVVRVSRMPVADLLQRLDQELGVRLSAEGEDVAGQRVDLFTHGAPVTAAEILAAIVELLNAECPPRGFRWERLGPAPRYRYGLVRDVASRRWEAEHAAAAEARMPELLRKRFAELGREPLPPQSGEMVVIPSMRKLLPLLTPDQFARLCADHYVSLQPADWTAAQKSLWRQMVQELVDDYARREPERTRQVMARYRSPEEYENPHMEVLIRGTAPRYLIEVGVGGPSSLGMLRLIGLAEDPAMLGPAAQAGASRSALPILDPDPVLTLPPRPPAPRGDVRADNSYVPWLMGELLADIAARARINLIADDYTRLWPELGRSAAPRLLSAYLSLIRDTYNCRIVREGKFLRLRNPSWFLDQRREVPGRDVARWRQMLRGSNANRLQILVEIAQRTPVSTVYQRLTWDRLRILDDYPELATTSRQEGGRTVSSFFGVVANRHLELLLYSRLPPARQREAFGAGLTIPWSEIPADLQQLHRKLAVRIKEPEAFRALRIFIRYQGDHLEITRDFPTRSIHDAMEVSLPAVPADDRQQLVGKAIPDLEAETTAGKAITLHPRGPLLLYVTPAWPRPLVAERETFADLQALKSLDAARVQVLGTQATAPELAAWWQARGLEAPPVALRPAATQQLGVRSLPLALVIGGDGRVTWVKEGYTPGDEAEWRRQLESAGR